MGKMNWLYKVAPFLDSKINFLSRNFRAGDKLLDLGCGDATYLGGILEYAPSLKISAVDVVDFKSKMPQGVDFFLVDISKDKLPFADNYFSGIFVNHVIEHLSNPHFAIKECARVLKQGGLVYIETPSVLATLNPFYNFYDDPSHIRPYTKRGLKRLMEESGIKVREIRTGGNLLWMFGGVFVLIYALLTFNDQLRKQGAGSFGWAIYGIGEKR